MVVVGFLVSSAPRGTVLSAKAQPGGRTKGDGKVESVERIYVKKWNKKH
jgi:hypothetical protein